MVKALARVLLILTFIYTIVLGGGFWGILLPEIRLFSLILLALIVLVWLIVRTRAGWRWHPTALDTALPVWALVFVMSLLMNPESARRSLLAMWYIGLYAGLWYVLHDAIANGGLQRKLLMDAVVMAGVVVMASTVLELQMIIPTLTVSETLYRVYSIIGNPNTLATYLVVMIMFVFGRVPLANSRASRSLLVVFSLLPLAVLLLTFSRSTWIGLGVGFGAWLIMLTQRRSLSVKDVRQWLNRQSMPLRLTLTTAAVVGVLAAITALVLFVQSFLGDGRGLSYRPELFNIAFNMFADNPLTGQGLFSYGRYVGRFTSLPPAAYHSHPHSLPVTLLGELGLLGLAAGLFTLYAIVRAVRRHWLQAASMPAEQAITAAGTGAAVAFFVTHLFDVPAVLPSIALTGLMALLVLCAPGNLRHVPASASRFGLRGFGVIGLWVGLFATGLWDTTTYNQYFDLLLAGINQDAPYADVADAMQPVREADPGMVIYPAQQGYFWGLAAAAGDTDASAKAIAAYEQAINIEPYYTPYYANLGALHWDNGDPEQALAFFQKAVDLAPESWSLYFNLGQYAEAGGMTDVARQAYSRALAIEPDADLHPAWGDTALQTAYSTPVEERDPLTQVVLLLEAGDTEAAIALWADTPAILNPRHYIVEELLALAHGDIEMATAAYEKAQQALGAADRALWLLLGELRLAQARGDTEAAALASDSIRDLLAYNPSHADYLQGGNMATFQYYRQAAPRQFLPGVFYSSSQPLLSKLLMESIS
ncbi:MAG: hypothetical protein CL610_28985 [Anaerolineaceae bacterium]|nr:hypothetical protein [Anaerolineaceae bacterium]